MNVASWLTVDLVFSIEGRRQLCFSVNPVNSRRRLRNDDSAYINMEFIIVIYLKP